MTKQKFFIVTIVGLALVSGCTRKYDFPKQGNTSSVTIVNATVNAPAVIPTFTNSTVQWIATATSVSFGNSMEYGIPSGSTALHFWESSDTTQSLFNGSFDLAPQGIYTLFLCGNYQFKNTADTVFTMDVIPYHSVTDSTMSIRFINLSPDSEPLSVDVQGNSPGSTITSLPYKSVSAFVSYSATSAATAPTFEIRDAASGNILLTTSASILPFKSMTVAVIGQESPSGTVPLSTITVNNY
jgi:hypothetical protein